MELHKRAVFVFSFSGSAASAVDSFSAPAMDIEFSVVGEREFSLKRVFDRWQVELVAVAGKQHRLSVEPLDPAALSVELGLDEEVLA